MNLLRTLTIRGQLTWIVMTTTCVALLVCLLALAVFDQWSFRLLLSENLLTRARITAHSSTAALSFGDPRPAAEVLESLGADDHLGAAAVFDKNGRVLAEYRRPEWRVPLPAPRLREPVAFHADHLEVHQSVVVDGRIIGSVVLQSDLGRMHERRNRTAFVGVVVLLAAAGIGYVLAKRLQQVISRPIQALLGTSREVAAHRNYAVRVTKENDDELGRLVDGFNEMLLQIEARDAALRQAQSELEHRVAERTRELFLSNAMLKDEVDAHVRARAESEALRAKLESANEHLQREAEQRFEVQEALRRSEERFSKAFRASPVALAIITRSTRMFVDVNDRFAELGGAPRERIIGSAMFSLPLWTVPETRARIEQALADGRSLRNWECRIAGRADQPRAAQLSAEAFHLGSEPCLLLMTEDISERVNLEGQLRQAQKMEAIGQLASGVAHDFNNLLTIIQGYTQLVLAMQPAKGVAREALEKITNATQRAAQLTGQLLTFSRKQIAKPKPIDVNQVVGNVTGMLRPLLGENVRLQCQPAPVLPLVEGDAGMLEQVIVNLAVNARDAMPKGGDLVLRTFTCDVDPSNRKYQPQAVAGPCVCLQVSDSGCGMDAPTLDRIFEPFFTTKGVGKGTGLGLATAYGIIKQHRGWIEVASQVGVGTTFKVFLPAAQATTDANDTPDASSSVRGGNELILVVEDEPALRELVLNILRGFGYEVLEASHGKEAITLWQRTDRKPAMLLTDMMMPGGMTGWELAERLRGEAPELKVVYTSGYSPELFGGKVKLHDRSNFLPKPFHPRTLAQTVRQCLDN